MRKIICLFVALLVASPAVHASSSSAAASKAAAADAKANAAKKKAEEQRKIQSNLAYLKQYLPNLTAADLKGLCPTDLRELYYHYQAYRVQGSNMVDARLKADQMKLDWF